MCIVPRKSILYILRNTPRVLEAAVAIAALALSVKNDLFFSSISFDIIDDMIPNSRNFDLLYDSNSESLVFIRFSILALRMPLGSNVAGKFDPPPEIVFDPKDFTATLDPSGILKARILNQMKTRDSELELYNRSKLRLFGIISSMMSKEMDEKIRSFFTDKANAAGWIFFSRCGEIDCELGAWLGFICALLSA